MEAGDTLATAGLTPALGMYALAAFLAATCQGVSGFGSGIIIVLGWQVANLLQVSWFCTDLTPYPLPHPLHQAC